MPIKFLEIFVSSWEDLGGTILNLSEILKKRYGHTLGI